MLASLSPVSVRCFEKENIYQNTYFRVIVSKMIIIVAVYARQGEIKTNACQDAR